MTWKMVRDGAPGDGRYLVSVIIGGHRYVRVRARRYGRWITEGWVYAWDNVPEAALLLGDNPMNQFQRERNMCITDMRRINRWLQHLEVLRDAEENASREDMAQLRDKVVVLQNNDLYLKRLVCRAADCIESLMGKNEIIDLEIDELRWELKEAGRNETD